jgi:rhodanese-related sulfurtransferase
VVDWVLHFFDEEKIKQLTKGYELIEIKEFEEGTLPKRIYEVVLRKNNGGTGMSEKIVVDVRDKDDYEKDHIPGAKSIPVSELEQRISELNKDTEIQIVCNRGGLKSSKAAEVLKEKGFNKVEIIEGGMESWKNKR